MISSFGGIGLLGTIQRAWMFCAPDDDYRNRLMQMQPYSRSETLPVPVVDQRGPLAERTGPDGYAGGNGYSGHSANGYQPSAQGQFSHPSPVQQPSYLQVLIEHCLKRWKLLTVCLIVASGVAFWMVKTYGRPMWRAEGSLYYSPNYSFANKRLYTPPNIQTMISLVKSPELLEQVRKERNLNVSSDQMQNRLTVNVLRQSDIISIQFDWPDREEGEAIARRVQELAIVRFDDLRSKLSKESLERLKVSLADTNKELKEAEDKLAEMLDRKGISNLTAAKSSVTSEIDEIRRQIRTAESDKIIIRATIKAKDDEIEKLEKKLQGTDAALSEAELNFLTQMRSAKIERLNLEREMEMARPMLASKRKEYERILPLVRKGYYTTAELEELQSKIRELEIKVGGTDRMKLLDKELVELEDKILSAKRGANALPVQQVRNDKINEEAKLAVIPARITAYEGMMVELEKRQKFLSDVSREMTPLQLTINQLQIRAANLEQQNNDHKDLGENKIVELTIHSPATAGGAPISTNTAKILVAVFGVAMLLFVGFVALRDMPRFAHTGQNTAERANLPVLAKYAPQAVAIPAPRLPTPDLTGEQLRLLADRIATSISGNGAIVLFTPAVIGLRVEALVADLGCFCAQRGGKVLVFDARPLPEHPNAPAWVGPTGNGVEEQLVAYLDGVSENIDACFTPTLIQSIDYARGDLAKHLAGVMAMYRFRRLTHELRERYSVVLMITPERYKGGDDFFTNVAEGIVVVLSEDANPTDMESYIQRLRGGDTPVFGAVTVPTGR